MSNLDAGVLANELQALKGAYLDNVWDIGSKVLKFRFRLAGKRLDMIIAPPERMHLTEYSYPAIVLSGFCTYLRKKLRNLKIEAVSQHDLDRVITISFAKGLSLVVELFGEGNLIVVDSDGKTLSAFRSSIVKICAG